VLPASIFSRGEWIDKMHIQDEMIRFSRYAEHPAQVAVPTVSPKSAPNQPDFERTGPILTQSATPRVSS
jgi:hypothetical protein